MFKSWFDAPSDQKCQLLFSTASRLQTVDSAAAEQNVNRKRHKLPSRNPTEAQILDVL